MGMSFWGAFAAPILAQAAPIDQTTVVAEAPWSETVAVAAADEFSGFAEMDVAAMSDAAGGAATAIDIGILGVNSSDQTGGVAGVTVNGATGGIAGNSVANNTGFTTVFSNTGNGVVFQNTVNVNIFLGSATSN